MNAIGMIRRQRRLASGLVADPATVTQTSSADRAPGQTTQRNNNIVSR
jgi:hypothetical protein